jgi:serine/threonine protein kinase
MEYCAGGSVSDLMRAADAPLPEPLIAFVTRHTLAGLAYLHSVGKVASAAVHSPAGIVQ